MTWLILASVPIVVGCLFAVLRTRDLSRLEWLAPVNVEWLRRLLLIVLTFVLLVVWPFWCLSVALLVRNALGMPPR